MAMLTERTEYRMFDLGHKSTFDEPLLGAEDLAKPPPVPLDASDASLPPPPLPFSGGGGGEAAHQLRGEFGVCGLSSRAGREAAVAAKVIEARHCQEAPPVGVARGGKEHPSLRRSVQTV